MRKGIPMPPPDIDGVATIAKGMPESIPIAELYPFFYLLIFAVGMLVGLLVGML